MAMAEAADKRVYLSIEDSGERLVIDGSLVLLCDFVRGFQPDVGAARPSRRRSKAPLEVAHDDAT